jgi:hypothetical protein
MDPRLFWDSVHAAAVFVCVVFYSLLALVLGIRLIVAVLG